MNFLTRSLSYVSYFIPSIPMGFYAYQAISFEHNTSISNVSERIGAELKPFFEKMGLRKDLIVHEETPPHDYFIFYASRGVDYFVHSHGTNYANLEGVIYADPELCNLERDGCNFFVKHEAMHIKFQDNFMLHALPFISSLIVAPITSILSPRSSLLSRLSVQMMTSVAIQASFSQITEMRADSLAIEESTIEELRGGKRLLVAMQSCFTEAYFLEMPLYHPSFDSRIQKIEASLAELNSQTDMSEIGKIDNLIQALKPLMHKKAGTIDFDRRARAEQASSQSQKADTFTKKVEKMMEKEGLIELSSQEKAMIQVSIYGMQWFTNSNHSLAASSLTS